MNKFEELQNRVKNDYKKKCEELEEERFNSGENASTFYIRRAYELAHLNEIVDVICDCCDPEDEVIDEDTCDNALKCENNLLDAIFESWMDYSHPERYNFFCYEDLINIIDYALRNC